MNKQVVSSVVLILLAGFLLLGLLTSNTYSLARDQKKLDFLQKRFNIDEDSQPIAQPVLIYPNYKTPFVQSVLPGPLLPPPDTTRKR